MQHVAFPSSVESMCLGVGSRAGAEDLGASDLALLGRIADGVHRRDGWRRPIDPERHAIVEGVELVDIARDFDATSSAWENGACYPVAVDAREQVLWKAYALAAPLLLRHRVPCTGVRRWTLAGLLVAPAWVVEAEGLDRLERQPLAAPPWLFRLRARLLAERVA